MQKHIHQSQTPRILDDLMTTECPGFQELLLIPIEFAIMKDEVIGGQKESPGPAGWICNGFTGLRTNAGDHRLDECTGCKILTCTALCILSILFQQSFVDIPLDIRYAAQTGVFPLARCQVQASEEGEILALETLDSPWNIDIPSAPLQVMSLAPDSNPEHRPHLLE